MVDAAGLAADRDVAASGGMGAARCSLRPASHAAWWRTVAIDPTLGVGGPVVAAARWPQWVAGTHALLSSDDLAVLLTDPDPTVRRCGGCALYRVAAGAARCPFHSSEDLRR